MKYFPPLDTIRKFARVVFIMLCSSLASDCHVRAIYWKSFHFQQHRYKRCFVGQKAVEWMCAQKFAASRTEV